MPEYRAYHDAKNRCNNPKNPWFYLYGGLGIKFELPPFEEFLAFIGSRPTKKHSLDRINSKGDYTLNNIRWATKSQQSYNRRLCSKNKSGISGVDFKKQKFWYATGQFEKKYYHLYCGEDFFEACCARKSWENLCQQLQ